MSSVVKRSVTISGHPTSVSLEQEFWQALREIAQKQNTSVPSLISKIDKTRTGGLSSALRIYILKNIKDNKP